MRTMSNPSPSIGRLEKTVQAWPPSKRVLALQIFKRAPRGAWSPPVAGKAPDAHLTQTRLYVLLNAIRLQESTYKSAGSVHGCALFQGEHLKIFVEDVGRHNAIDTIAGWMWMHHLQADADSVFYTTGRLTSEMVMKSAQMGVAVVVSRSGITQMGFDVATRLGLCTIGRATNKHFLCYTAHDRLQLQPELAVGGVHKVQNA